jgi:hypothetical protein
LLQVLPCVPGSSIYSKLFHLFQAIPFVPGTSIYSKSSNSFQALPKGGTKRVARSLALL